MKKIAVALIAVLIPVLLLGIYLFSKANEPPVWQTVLDQYLGFRTRQGWQVTVKQVVPAQEPWKFTAEMSLGSYGQTNHYRLDHPYAGRPGQRPLPYPPQQLWCALLAEDRDLSDASQGDTSLSVVLAARHEDMYNADWVVHDGGDWPAGAAVPAQLTQTLQAIGCDLTLK